jgi:hypothetical protein
VVAWALERDATRMRVAQAERLLTALPLGHARVGSGLCCLASAQLPV